MGWIEPPKVHKHDMPTLSDTYWTDRGRYWKCTCNQVFKVVGGRPLSGRIVLEWGLVENK